LGRAQAESANDLGANRFDLPEQEGRTCGCFVRLRRPVLRRATLYDVADVNLIPVETDCEDHFIEQFSGSADERTSLPVFIEPRAFADENQAAFGRTFAKHQIGAPAMKSASCAPCQLIAYPQEFFLGLGNPRRLHLFLRF
jgi:hypothetical protein